MLKLTGHSEADVRKGRLSDLPERIKTLGREQAAQELGIGVPTLMDVMQELMKPGRDVRDSLPQPILRTDVMEISDLKPGMILQGTVRNVIDSPTVFSAIPPRFCPSAMWCRLPC